MVEEDRSAQSKGLRYVGNGNVVTSNQNKDRYNQIKSDSMDQQFSTPRSSAIEKNLSKKFAEPDIDISNARPIMVTLQNAQNQNNFKTSSGPFESEGGKSPLLFPTTTLPLETEENYQNITSQEINMMKDDVSPRFVNQEEGITQGAQTSFRPVSIKDSAEFKKISESILRLSYDRKMVAAEEEEGSQFINMQDFKKQGQLNGGNNMDESDLNVQQMMMSSLHQNASTRRKNSVQSEGKSQLPRSAVETSWRSSRTKKQKSGSKSPAGRKNSGNNNNQILRQIYISVNTFEDRSNQQQPTASATGKPIQQRRGTIPMGDLPAASDAIDLNVGSPKESVVFGHQTTNDNDNNQNQSLIIQPMLLGIRAVSRLKKSDQQSKSPKNDNLQVSGAKSIGFTEFVFKGTSSTSPGLQRRSATSSQMKIQHRKPNHHHNSRAKAAKLSAFNQQKKATKKIENKKPMVKRYQSMPADYQDFTEHNLNMLTNDVRVDQEGQQNKIFQLVLGPQIVSSLDFLQERLSPEEQINMVSNGGGTTTATSPNLTQAQGVTYYGKPIVIDSNSNLGRQFLEEQRIRNEMKLADSKPIQRRQAEKQKERDIAVEFRHLLPNLRPVPHPNKFLEKKAALHIHRDKEFHKLEVLRNIAWKEHQLAAKKVHKKGQKKNEGAEFGIADNAGQPFVSENQPHINSIQPWSQEEYSHQETEEKQMSKTPFKDDTHLPSTTNLDNIQVGGKDGLSCLDSAEMQQQMRIQNESEFAKQIAKAAEAAREMNPDNFHEIQEIIYKTLSQTDILNQPELQETLSQEKDRNPNPNAIELRTASIQEIAPVLHYPSTVSPQVQSFRSASEINQGMDIKSIQDMNIDQFSETIKNMYLPFTLRKMYYKELQMRKPLFLGASKKNIGFGANKSQVLNERTCIGQHKQRVLAETQREIIEANYAKIEDSRIRKDLKFHGLSIDENLFKISQVQFSHTQAGKSKDRKNKDVYDYERCCQKKQYQVSCKNQASDPRQNEQGAQTDLRDFSNMGIKQRSKTQIGQEDLDQGSIHDKNIDIQSFGAMTGVDQFAVREIEQLMLINSQTELKDIPKMNNLTQASAAHVLVKSATCNEEKDGGPFNVQKNSKVIFSVKKNQEQTNNSHNNLKQDMSINLLKQNVLGIDGSQVDQSVQRVTYKPSRRASSALSQQSSNKGHHEILDPRSKQFSTSKKVLLKNREKNKSRSQSIESPFVLHTSIVDQQAMVGQTMLSLFANQTKEDKRIVTDQSASQMQPLLDGAGEFDLQFISQKYSGLQENNLACTDRTPGSEHNGPDPPVDQQNLIRVDVSQVQILVTQEVEPSESAAVNADIKKLNEQVLQEQQLDKPLKSYTCVDLDNEELNHPRSMTRKIKSAKMSGSGKADQKSKQSSAPKKGTTITNEVKQRNKEKGEQNLVSQQQPRRKSADNKTTFSNKKMSSRSNSNIGRITLQTIQDTAEGLQEKITEVQPVESNKISQQPVEPQQQPSISHTQQSMPDEQQHLQGALLVSSKTSKIQDKSSQNIHYTGGFVSTKRLKSNENLKKQKNVEVTRTLSPNILNLQLTKAASLSPHQQHQQVLNQFRVNLRSSVRLQENVRQAHQDNNKSIDNSQKSPTGVDIHGKPVKEKKFKYLKGKKTLIKEQTAQDSPERIEEIQRGSFYISEDSQRTLTPLTCKPYDQQPHSSGYILHRGCKLQNKSSNLVSRGHSIGIRVKSDSSNSPASMSPKLEQPNKATRLVHDFNAELKPNCTCTLKGTYKLDELHVHPQLSNQSAQNYNSQQADNSNFGGKNRVVFVVRNEENRILKSKFDTTLTADATLIKNGDLAQILPKYDEEFPQPNNEHQDSNNSNKQTIFHVGQPTMSIDNNNVPSPRTGYNKNNAAISIPHNTDNCMYIPIDLSNAQKQQQELLKKSASNEISHNNTTGHSIARLVQQAVSQRENINNNEDNDIISDSRNFLPRTAIAREISDQKCMTPQSSQQLAHVFPVNSSKDIMMKQTMSNQSYPDIIQIQQKKEKFAVKKQKILVDHQQPKVEVKHRLSKNPNQCPPRRNIIRPATTTGGSSTNNRPKNLQISNSMRQREQSTASSRIISIQVQNEGEKKLQAEEAKKAQQITVNPNYNSLQPYSIIATDQMNETVLSLKDQDERYQQESTIVQPSNHYQNQLTLSESLSRYQKKKRPMSQYANNNSSRMDRLQRFYQTQRGKNIMSLAGQPSSNNEGSKKHHRQWSRKDCITPTSTACTINKTVTETNGGIISKEFPVKFKDYSKFRTNRTTMLKTQRAETMVALNSHQSTILADPGSQNVQSQLQMSSKRQRNNDRGGLQLIGKTAAVRNSNDIILLKRGIKSNPRQKSALLKNLQVDASVQQSIQRFSIHLSPQNKTMAIMAQNSDKECEIHQNMLPLRESSNGGFGLLDGTPERIITPLHFLPAMPQNEDQQQQMDQTVTSEAGKGVLINDSNTCEGDQEQITTEQEVMQQQYQRNSEENQQPNHKPMIISRNNMRNTDQTAFQPNSLMLQQSSGPIDLQVRAALKHQQLQKQHRRPMTTNGGGRNNIQQHHQTQQNQLRSKQLTNRQFRRQNQQSQNHHERAKSLTQNTTKVGIATSAGDFTYTPTTAMTPNMSTSVNLRQKIVKGLAQKHFNTMTTREEINPQKKLDQHHRQLDQAIADEVLSKKLQIMQNRRQPNGNNIQYSHNTQKIIQQLNQTDQAGNRPPAMLKLDTQQRVNGTASSNGTLLSKTPTAVIQQNNVNMFDRQTNSSFINSASDIAARMPQNNNYQRGGGQQSKKHQNRVLSQDLMPILKYD